MPASPPPPQRPPPPAKSEEEILFRKSVPKKTVAPVILSSKGPKKWKVGSVIKMGGEDDATDNAEIFFRERCYKVKALDGDGKARTEDMKCTVTAKDRPDFGKEQQHLRE